MREYSVPAIVRVGATENVADAVFDNGQRFGSSVAFRRRTAGSDWFDVTAREFAIEVRNCTAGLIAAGVQRGDRVAVMSETRYEWTLIDYSIAAAGGITVPIYPTSSAEQVGWVLADSQARAVVVGTAEQLALVAGLRPALPDIAHVWSLDDHGIAQIVALGTGRDPAAVDRRRAEQSSDDVATVVYTSGTTGRPKGCMLTHRNLLSGIRLASEIMPTVLVERGSVLLFLPMAHIFGKVIQCGAVYTRTTIGHTSAVADLRADLAAFRPTFLLAVPRVFDKVYQRARLGAAEAGKAGLFDRAESTAVQWSRAIDAGGPGPVLRLRHGVYRALVYRRVLAALGGRCTAAVSGGAPLGERLAHFYRGIGLPVYEGYGMTETSGGITINTPDAARVGTVGRPVPGQAVRIADDGEVLLRGETIFRGYWDNLAATAAAFTADGWLRSGDLGELDDAGFLRITGRKKEIIVTAGGKNVAPALLEDRLRAHPLISQAMVVGDRQRFVGALITIDPEALPPWRERHAKPAGEGAADLVDDPDLRAEVATAVLAANAAVSRAESIREFRILPVDFSEERGEVTPTMKLRRCVVEATYAAEINAIYG